MKKVLSLLGIFAISLGLFGCQAFQPPADTAPSTTTDKEVAGEVSTEDQNVSVTITDEVADTATQEASVTITDGGDADGTATQEASVTIAP